jgi:hypothetical protein
LIAVQVKGLVPNLVVGEWLIEFTDKLGGQWPVADLARDCRESEIAHFVSLRWLRILGATGLRKSGYFKRKTEAKPV